MFKIKGGGPHFLDSQGSCWTAAYIQEGGNVVRDLRANISAEAGARQTYESLIKACDDEGTKKTLHHLLTREITHANMFMKALDQMGKLDDPFFGNIPPDETVKLVFNLSQGEDERGSWNEEPDFEYVENPELKAASQAQNSRSTMDACGSTTGRASASGPSGPTTCGRTTSCRTALRTAGGFAC